ncbi:hypothetical protein [Epilithonimonas hungarica]|uniref:Signal peptidase n=1 Tax=Epilithonimonas hungarica TaxID=454006 RepID=A0A1G7GQ37_9FLAO|nr:hypothetical protein [Epilithonimonas hungarica]MDP9956757.1 hypothetical protein [Epilithonimonas hungarica]MPT31224.1 hypothetical protein [Chryseobacterium sp.]SDE90278.1 hypothetical protein SAMN05421825_0540 [Epilithonimonas hungarica]
MMDSLFKKAYSLIFILISMLSFAQSVPPPPENPESGGIGAYPASPIDGYTFILFLAAILMIVVFALRSRKRLLQ